MRGGDKKPKKEKKDKSEKEKKASGWLMMVISSFIQFQLLQFQVYACLVVSILLPFDLRLPVTSRTNMRLGKKQEKKEKSAKKDKVEKKDNYLTSTIFHVSCASSFHNLKRSQVTHGNPIDAKPSVAGKLSRRKERQRKKKEFWRHNGGSLFAQERQWPVLVLLLLYKFSPFPEVFA